jgi:hypothetical protein
LPNKLLSVRIIKTVHLLINWGCEIELHEFTAQTYPSLTLPWEEMLLMPVGDTQHGAQGADLPKMARHIKWGVKHNAYFTDLGDSLDLASPSTRSKISSAELYDIAEDALDYYAYKLLDEYLEAVEPSKGRWLLKCKGHHLWKFKSGKYKSYDSDDVIADFLGCPVTDELGAGLTQIKFKSANAKRSQTCQVFQWHGGGHASTRTGVMNKIEKIGEAWPSADVVLVGHYPFKIGWGLDYPEPHFGKHPFIRDRRRIYASTGGFARTYQVGGRASYGEKGGMRPNNIGGVLIKIRPVHEEWGDRLDMNVEA